MDTFFALTLTLSSFFFYFRIQPDSEQFTFCNGVVLHRNQCQQSFGEWLGAIVEFSRALHSMELDLSAFACLCALTLVNGKW